MGEGGGKSGVGGCSYPVGLSGISRLLRLLPNSREGGRELGVDLPLRNTARFSFSSTARVTSTAFSGTILSVGGVSTTAGTFWLRSPWLRSDRLSTSQEDFVVLPLGSITLWLFWGDSGKIRKKLVKNQCREWDTHSWSARKFYVILFANHGVSSKNGNVWKHISWWHLGLIQER